MSTRKPAGNAEELKENWNPNVKDYSGGYSEGVTPVPISNTEVKSFSADGTAGSLLRVSQIQPCGRVGRRRIQDEKAQ